MDARSLKRDTVIALAWKFLERGAYQVVSLAVQVILARMLSPNEFGIMAILAVFINLSNAVVQTGLSNAIVQARRCTEGDYSSVLLLSICISAGLYALIFAVCPFIADFYGNANLSKYLRILALVLFINSYNAVQNAHALREMRTKSIFKSTVIGALSSGFIAIVLAVCNFGVWALIAQTMMMQLVSCIALAQIDGWAPCLKLQLRGSRRFWAYGWKITASGLLYNLYQNIFDLIIGRSFSTSELGLFSQGRKIPYVVANSFDGSIQTVMLSALSKIAGDRNGFKSALRRSIKTAVLITSPIMFAMAALSPIMVPVVFGERWVDAIPYFSIFAIGYSLVSVSSSNQQALSALGRSDILLVLELVKTFFGLSILFTVLHFIHSTHAVAVGAAAFLLISVFINSYPNSKMIGYSIKDQLKDILPTYCLAFACAVPVWIVSCSIAPSVLGLLILAGLYVLMYASSCLLFKLESALYVFSLLKKIIKVRR